MEIGKDKNISKIIGRLGEGKAIVRAEGTWGSFGALLASHIQQQTERTILYIRPHIEDADKTADDLQTFGAKNIEPLAAWEGEEALADATDEIRTQRNLLALKAGGKEKKLVIPASIQAICQPIPKISALQESRLVLGTNQEKSPEEVAEWLIDNNFERVERIDLPGQFARRGGIIDIYAPLASETGAGSKAQQGEMAVRLEFFGDNIESIRQVNLDTLLSAENITSLEIISPVCGMEKSQQELFINILPADALIILEEPNDIEEVARVFLERVEGSERLFGWGDIYNAMGKFRQLHLCKFGAPGDENAIKLDVKSVQQYQHKSGEMWSGHKSALEQLAGEARGGKKVCLYCESSAEIKRVSEIIEEICGKIPANFELIQGFVNQGFMIESLNTIVISHHEIFGQYALRRRQRPIQASIPVDTLDDLQVGDYVVHVSYGIGKFRGTQTIQEKNAINEYLTIEFDNKVKIHVPTSNIALIQKYIGTSPKRPKLSRIGSKKWQKQKEQAEKSIENLASELLEMQAKRQFAGGIEYGPDSEWQREFEEAFAYQETADQITAIEQIKGDMQANIAMDRLLCGDVGYGKTELAMRAAFKAAENGKQVAVLVPTTVLSVQHGRTFGERFADFPVTIEVLNRFKTSRQAKEIVQRAREGQVDILIGTHRLLSRDIGFNDLGLLIIDEEQRFGVAHKERLKRMRVNVDVLTMTATPIPRTLHMSLLGLRDISSLATPPLDRRSVVTTIAAYNEGLIRKAILHELNRQGQVFFLHNRVKTIDRKAHEIRKILNDENIRIGVAHGQMPKSRLEKEMINFVMGKTDVLVCTTIIESGLDIPNANTIFIDEADKFGLAELHQLRGRVGRYKHRAYAYMLLPPGRPVTPIAAKRLKAIEEYSHLGAGFRIALRDLEIRGAGNILGPEQSGHIQMIGYQMYCQLLSEAVKKLKHEPVEKLPSAIIEIGFSAYIPKNYIPSDRQRMEVYRRIAVARNNDDIEQIKNELKDVYGELPEEVGLLLELAQLRIAADRHGIKSIVASGQNLVFSFTEQTDSRISSLFAKVKGNVSIANPNTVYLRLGQNYFEPRTLISVLKKILCKGR